jgi:2-phosphosulfolactate phosphatase
VRLDVALTPPRLDREAIPRSTVLVVDVLRASTTMITALGNGCAAIVPVADPGDARQQAGTMHPRGLLAGERRGQTIAGFDLGNSPLEVTRARVGGRTLVFTTSNGTAALLTVRHSPAVGLAAFVNLGAASSWAVGGGRDVIVVCSGERGAISLEDQVCAGLLVDRMLREEPRAETTAAARDALEVGRGYGKAVGRLAEDSPWARHLARAGRGDDVAACLVLDTTTLVPVLRIDKVVVGSR